ncbi:hypothetical protein LIER_30175 [Lithospermum erythrorhizon]|uniref:Putative plant transposon protein domain-containing protein n=1 Tax=Lithospermum erythrorhizon TaxID=34254 RepID=A0AAV3RQS0_LITER
MFISEPSQSRNKDKFIVDDLEESSGEDDACTARRKLKGKMKINYDRNRINNRRIAKGIEEISTEEMDFNFEENEVRWNSVCARNILPERYLSKATMKNQTYMNIIEESGMLAISDEIGPHWPSLVREFICNLTEEIADPASVMFHKVKMRGHVFEFNPAVINRHYGRQNKGITSSTLKLADIIKTLTGNALSVWPIKGQLPASSLSLRYAVMHKMAIANLVSTSNDTNVSEVVGRMMYVMGYGQELDFDRILKARDGSGKDAKPLTIIDKLISEKRVVDVEIKRADKPAVGPEGEAAALLIKAYEEEQSCRPKSKL